HRRRRAVPRAVQRAHRPRDPPGGARLLGARGRRRVGDRLSHAGAAPSERPGPERRARDPRPPRRGGRVRDLSPSGDAFVTVGYTKSLQIGLASPTHATWRRQPTPTPRERVNAP